MTSGERMVWAAEFVRVLALPGCVPAAAARLAKRAVDALEEARHGTSHDALAMLDDMLSNGADR